MGANGLVNTRPKGCKSRIPVALGLLPDNVPIVIVAVYKLIFVEGFRVQIIPLEKQVGIVFPVIQ
jgi:hypothetical protein